MIREEILISNFIPAAAGAAPAAASAPGSSVWKWVILIALILLALWYVFSVYRQPANPQN